MDNGPDCDRAIHVTSAGDGHVRIDWASSSGIPHGLLWGLTGAFFLLAGPVVIILVGMWRGHYADHHLLVREHRRIPLATALVLTIVGLAVLVVLNAPQDILAAETVMLAALVILIPITRRWKISIHTCVAVTVSLILTVTFSAMATLMYPLAATIGWSRVRLGDHTVRQVLAGALVAGVSTVPALLFHR